MVVDEVLKHEVVRVLFHKVFGSGAVDFSDGIKHVFAHVFVSVLLKHFPGKRLFLILNSMYKMTKITPLTSLRAMIIFARHSSIIANFNNLIFNFLLFQLWAAK